MQITPTKEQLETPIASNIKALRSSPLFQLSLGSKELFHSNFLAWLFEMYPQESGRALSHFLKDGTGDVAVDRVMREQKNRDLTIYFKNGQELIIENKVKSLPYIGQLQMYSEGAEANQNFLLLSLMPPPFADGSVIKTGHVAWNVLTYAELPAIIGEIKKDTQDDYHRAILDDYMVYISAMGRLFVSSAHSDSDLFSFYSTETDTSFAVLKSVRMGDIYQKLQYEMLAAKVFEALRRAMPDTEIFLENPTTKVTGDQVYVGYGMTRATGLMEARICLKENWTLVVQIQGDSYKQMVVGPDSQALHFAGVLKDQKLWFDFLHIDHSKEYPNKDGFNAYEKMAGGVSAYYRRISLKPSFTVGQVVDFLVRDIRHAIESKDRMVAIM